MASPANANGPVAFPSSGTTPTPVAAVPQTQNHTATTPQPGNYVPRVASTDPAEQPPSQSQISPAVPRTGNHSPVAPTAGAGKSQTVFIHKLFDMLEDASLAHLIWWSPTQDSFCLYPGEEFSNVLAQYFKHTNIASFIRQLNMYGFHKVNDNFQAEDKHDPPQQTRWEFRHAANHFRKGDVGSLSLIKRKSSKVMSSHKEIVSLKTLPPTSDAPVDTKDADTPESYHSSVYQQSWNQLAPGSVASRSKEPPRQGNYPPVLGQYGYPMYATVGVPHSPSSPVPDHPVGSPSYFLHSGSHPSLQQQPLSQPSSQPQSRQTSVQTPVLSLESSINFRIIELGTAVNGLKAAYSDLLARHESLSASYQKGQTDLLQLTEIVERLTSRADEQEKQEKSDKEKSDKEKHDEIDRKLANTPINRVCSPGLDGMSPTAVKAPKHTDLAAFKSSLKSNLGADHKTAKPHSYHLSDAIPRPVPGIVPQPYPLNPNYTLYNDGLRPANMDEKAARPHANRQVSVLMDPLQPAPKARGVHASAASPMKKTASESSVKEEDHASQAGPAPLGNPANTTASASSEPPVPVPYVQPYQPFPAALYYQHMVNDPSHIRTTSLPVMSHPLPQRLTSGTPQRHSLNSIIHYRAETEESPALGSSGSIGSLGAPPPSSNLGSSRPTTALMDPVAFKPKPDDPAKKQLPSMEELNKSLRGGSPAHILSFHSGEEDENLKRRKLDE